MSNLWAPISLGFFSDRKEKKLPPLVDVDLSPQFWNIKPGEKLSSTVAVNPLGMNKTNVLLSARESSGAEIPEGISIGFDPSGGLPPFTSKMSIVTSPELRPQTYSFLVVAKSGITESEKTCVLVVQRESAKETKVQEKSYSEPILPAPPMIAGKVPLYPNAFRRSVNEKEKIVVYSISDSPEDAVSFYQVQMKRLGWKSKSETDEMPFEFIFTKDDSEVRIEISGKDPTLISIKL